jgi:hypothetical protein
LETRIDFEPGIGCSLLALERRFGLALQVRPDKAYRANRIGSGLLLLPKHCLHALLHLVRGDVLFVGSHPPDMTEGSSSWPERSP